MNTLKTILTGALILFFGTSAVFAAETAETAEETKEEVRTIEIKGLDNLTYDVEEITASPGETLRISFETVSDMPPAAMQHNIAILDQGVDADEFAMASMMAADNEYIDPDMEDQVIAYTEMIAGGETSVIEFTVPETPGEYLYICTFPGHYLAGMTGVLIVES